MGLVNSNSTTVPMHEAAGNLQHNVITGTTTNFKQQSTDMTLAADQSMKHQMLSREEWFHGPISRKDAEQLLLEVY